MKKIKVGVGLVSEPEGGRRPNGGSETSGKVIRFRANHKSMQSCL